MQAAALKGIKRAVREGWTRQLRGPNDIRALAEGCWYDKKAAERVIRFFETCLKLKHPTNPRKTIPFTPLPWQGDDVLRPIFGWMQADGTRRFRRAHVWVPKKNGKTPLAAGIELYMLMADGEPEPEVYSVATTIEQAALVYKELKKIVAKSDALTERLQLRDHLKRVDYEAGNAFYKVLSKDADAADGINAHCVVFDELHRQRNRELWKVMQYAFAARRQPLLFIITTAGDDLASIGYEQFKLAQKIAAGIIEDTHTFVFIAAADDKDDWTDPKTWHKANPSLGLTINERQFAADCKAAQVNPAEKANFLRLRLNRWVGRTEAFVNMEMWMRATDEVDRRALLGMSCNGGLDISKNDDLTSLTLKFNVGAAKKFLSWSWLPEDKLDEKAAAHGVNYRQWVEEGWLELTPGDCVDHEFLRRRINEINKGYPMKEIAFDPAFASGLGSQLLDDGIPIFSFWQTARMYTPCLSEMDRLLRMGLFHHGKNPILTWAASNMDVKTGADGFMKPVKREGKVVGKIDPMVCALMALGFDLKAKKEEPPGAFELLLLD